MRMYKKRELLQCIGILKKANRQLRMVQYGAGNEVLEQCQELAIKMGEQIEEDGEDHSVIIGYLEEYCEMLYKAFVCSNSVEYKSLLKINDSLLKKIEKGVKEDIQNSAYEIVFLPYKASMWDAFDSVYRAAVGDKDCHVVVMPVPYYNMNQRDNQVEVHYEGDQFPEDVPVTDYQIYSLEEVHPDVIFIHNPYDQCNYVTQLPEQYFSSTLVHYTERLVYISYFITRGDSIKEDYCVMPAVKNAWRTFVQSESVRKCYVKYGADPNRIVAMGSPKFDMVIKSQENPPKVPEHWRSVFSGRKVFLLNTHLTAIINEAEKMIDKLHKIFKLFEQEKKAALLWRPHPLSIETAKAMNPQILGKYLEIIDEFKTLDNGVYDDTPDIHRAIAISDAYIGDWSSVATLYGITGKPMYIMSINVDTNIEESEKEKEEKERGLSFSCAAELDGYLWAPGDEVNGLFRICEETGESEFITFFMEEKSCVYLLYRRVIAFGRKLIFVPWMAEFIAEYNVDTKEMQYYSPYDQYDKGIPQFAECLVKGNKLYMFPTRVKNVICMDMESGELQQCKWDFDVLPEEIINLEYTVFLNAINVEDIEYLPCLRTNVFVKLSLKDFQSEAIRIPECKEGFIDVANEGDFIYLMSISGDVFSYSISTGKVELFWLNHEKRADSKNPYYKMLVYNGFLWLLAGFNEYICRINISTLESDIIEAFPEEFLISQENPGIPPYKWFNGEVRNGTLKLYPRRANMLLIWKNNQKEAKGIKIKMPEDKAWNQYKLLWNKNGYLYHEVNTSLFFFLHFCLIGNDGYKRLRQDYFRGLQCNGEGHCGGDIWEYIKGNLEQIKY